MVCIVPCVVGYWIRAVRLVIALGPGVRSRHLATTGRLLARTTRAAGALVMPVDPTHFALSSARRDVARSLVVPLLAAPRASASPGRAHCCPPRNSWRPSARRGDIEGSRQVRQILPAPGSDVAANADPAKEDGRPRVKARLGPGDDGWYQTRSGDGLDKSTRLRSGKA